MFTGTFLYSSNAFVHFLGFLPLGSGSGSESVHADPDPGGKTLSGSETLVRIVLIFKLKMLCNKGKWMMMMFGHSRHSTPRGKAMPGMRPIVRHAPT